MSEITINKDENASLENIQKQLQVSGKILSWSENFINWRKNNTHSKGEKICRFAYA